MRRIGIGTGKRIGIGLIVVVMVIPALLGFLWGIISTGYKIGVIAGCKLIPDLMEEPRR